MLANKSTADALRQVAKEGRVDVVQYFVERGVVNDDTDDLGKRHCTWQQRMITYQWFSISSR